MVTGALPISTAEATQPAATKVARPELVFGLVGPLGVPMQQVYAALESALLQVGYDSHRIVLSDAAADLPNAPQVTEVAYHEKALAKIKLGNWVRRSSDQGDAMARLAIAGIRNARQALTGEEGKPAPNRAYVLHQLKHPEEVRLLREVYGDRFILIGVYASPKWRLDHVSTKIANSVFETPSSEHRRWAEELFETDEMELDEEGKKVAFGQQVREAFPLSDVFVDAGGSPELEDALQRLVRILFEYLIHTPTKDEQGMFFAKAVAVRSASLGRQVGAAAMTPAGDLLTVGTNEVPKAKGGLYWEGDKPDDRTFHSKVDVSDQYRRALLLDVLEAVQKRGWLKAEHAELEKHELATLAFAHPDLLRETRIGDILEFVREVHAEMAAVTDAARRGIELRGSSLFVTTYPCHECARHIIAAGIERVVFIEPYAKSLAALLHSDVFEQSRNTGVAIEPFVGVAPRRYMEWFEMITERKVRDGTGNLIEWKPAEAVPRIMAHSNAYLEAEVEVTLPFLKQMGLWDVDIVE